MITRLYPNAKGLLQAVVLTKNEWDDLSEDALQNILGFDKPEPQPVEQPAKRPARKPAKGAKK